MSDSDSTDEPADPSRAEIIICEDMDEQAVGGLVDDFSVVYDPTLYNDRARLLRLMPQARGLVVRNQTKVDVELLSAARRLQVVGRLGAGLDNIDVEACEAADVQVRAAFGANATSVADYVVAALLLLWRPALGHTDRVVNGEWPRRESVGFEASGKRLGLVGFGATAREVAKRASALGMTVAAHDPQIDAADSRWQEAVSSGWDDLLESSDAISIHVPLTSKTHNLIDERAIQLMKPGSLLVNTSRGGIVDQHAVAVALRSGRLGGAALDVFETEPLSCEAAEPFADVPNLILTPHIAGLTIESSLRVAFEVAEGVRAILGASETPTASGTSE